MANKRKEKPTFNVDVNNSNNFNSIEAKSFIQSLIKTFQQGAYCILEALRLVKAKDKETELDLILNDEEHSQEYQMRGVINRLK